MTMATTTTTAMIADPRYRRPPALSTNLIALKHFESSGYGVFAAQSIPAGTTLLSCTGPNVHVVYRVFRREVCAWCFRYERGRNWRVRLETEQNKDQENLGEEGKAHKGANGVLDKGTGYTTGLVFCCTECKESWCSEYGKTGLDAYAAVEEHLRRQMRSKSWSGEGNADGVSGADELREPTEQEVETAWMDVDEKAEQIRAYRMQSQTSRVSSSDGESTADRRAMRKLQKQAYSEALKLPIRSPDTLFLLLSGVLCCNNSSMWAELLTLGPSQPYTSTSMLKETIFAYLQFLAILPLPLINQDVLSRPILEAIHARDRANSFGLWSTSPETDTEDPEMLGHGIWTSASFFNHSCSPSIIKEREGRVWSFSAARDIAAGEECCISYIRGEEDALDVKARRKRLQEGWGFVCACIKCVEEKSF